MKKGKGIPAFSDNMQAIRAQASLPKVVITKTGSVIEKIEIDGNQLHGVRTYDIHKEAGLPTIVILEIAADVEIHQE